ncbi:MAG TPA: MarR family transcriptional regulator [Anaerolineaceae bacterium]|nr:MarR family transcriptional regulator [Anaerolineaceae bacterium]
MTRKAEFRSALHDWTDVFLHHSMERFIATLKNSGLSMSQIGTLKHLGHHGPCRVTDISNILGVTNAAVSQLVERLVQQGLVLRTEDPHDRRLKQLALTDKGNQLLQEGILIRQRWLDDLVDTLTDAEQEQVIGAFRLLTEKASRLESKTAQNS